MSDQELKALLDTIETPPADLTGPVLDKLRGRKKKRFSTASLLLAALIGAGMLLGARQFYQYIMIGADGSTEEAQVCASEVALAESLQHGIEPDFWPEPAEPTDYYLMVAPDGVRGCSSPSTTDALPVSRLWELVADMPLKLPFLGKCPKGFTDGCGGTQFYISPDMADLPTAEWIDAGNGFYSQRFRLADTIWKNLDWYSFVLENEDRRIDFDVQLTDRQEKMLISGGAKSEKIKIGGLKAVYVEEPPDEFSPLGQTKVFFTGKIPETPYIYGFDLGVEDRKARGMEEDGGIREYTYRYYACTLTCEGLDRETVLETAQSIVFPEPGQSSPDFPAKYEKTYEDGSTVRYQF